MKLNYFKIMILVMIGFLIVCKLANAAELPKLKSNKNNYWQKLKQKRQENLKTCPTILKTSKTEEMKNTKHEVKKFAKGGVALMSQTSEKTIMATQTLIEISADSVINTNTVWDSDVHLNGKVYVENAMLTIMPGVVVWNSADGGIVVRNAGLIKANGTPYDWIVFMSDSPQPTWQDYDFAIKIESTASPLSEISYSYIESASKGIWTENIRLETPIIDNNIWWCYDGIVENGTNLTDIINNQIINCFFDAIDIYLADSNGTTTSTTHILMENNTIHGYHGYFYYGQGQLYGISVDAGLAGEEDAGIVEMRNNLISGCNQYAVWQANGYMEAYRICHGYFNNTAIENPMNPFDDIFPQVLTADPFVYGYTQYPFFLVQDCNLIDAGCMNIEQAPYLIAKTTESNGVPDSNVVDIGFHYIYWDYMDASTSLSADFDSSYFVGPNDLLFFTDYWLYDYQKNYEVWYWDWDDSGVIDIGDLSVIAEYWLSPFDFRDYALFSQHWQKQVDHRFQDSRPDLNKDGFVNFKDYALFSNQWGQTCEPMLANIVPNFDQDPNNLSGYVEMSISVIDPRLHRVFVLIDGKLHNEFGSLEEYPFVGIQTENFTNGAHSVKIVSQDVDGNIICSQINPVVFNNEMSMLSRDNGFEPAKDYLFYASGSGNYDAEVEDLVNETIIYTGSFVDEINIHVSAAFFVEEYGVYRVKLTKEEVASGTMVATASTQEIINFVIGRKFKKEDFDDSSLEKMVVSVGSKDVEAAKEPCWRAVVKAAVKKNFMPIFLNYEACTWDNLKHCLMLPNVKLWYHVAHGNYKLLFKPERTCVEINGGKLFSFLRKDYDPNAVPPDYESMGRYEKSPSVAELGFVNSSKMSFVQINACYSARREDFANMMGMFSDYNQNWWPPGKQIYIGWKDFAFKHDILPRYNGFEEDYWKNLSQGSSVKDAVWDAYTMQPGGRLHCYQNFWYYGAIYEQKYFNYPY